MALNDGFHCYSEYTERLQERGKMKVTGRILPKFPRAVCVIILCAFFKAVAYWALTPYLPMYLGNRLGISVENSGYLIGLGSLSGTIMSIFCGFLIDRRDKKKIFALSLSVMAVSYLIFPGMSNGFLILGVLMVINIASSSLAIVTNAWFSIMLSEEESTKAFSIKYILENIGAMVGPVLGTVLVKLNLRFPFYVASASLVLITLIFFVYSKALVSSPVNGKIDVGKTEDLGIGQTMRLLVQDKRLLYFTIGGVLSMMIYGALVTFMSLFFSSVLPYDEAYQRVAYISALNAAIVMGLQYFVSAVIRKKTIMRWVRFAVGSMMAGLIILIFRSDLLWLTAAIVLLSFGEVAIVPAEYLFIIKITPKEQRGVYLGAQNMIVLGLSISPVLCGYLLKEATASMMFAVLCIILVFSLAFYQMGYSVSEKAETI